MGVIDRAFDAAYESFFKLIGKEQADPVAREEVLPGLTTTGFIGPKLGRHEFVEAPPEFEASSMQVCGFWPFSVGASSALVGSVLGKHFFTGAPVCGDPMTLFTRGVISAPSAFVLALNGRGKSSLVVRMLLGIVDNGDLLLVTGDLKPDYVGLVESIGGRVFSIGRGTGGMNVLDAGPWKEWLPRLSPAMQTKIRSQVHGRRVNALSGLIELLVRDELSEERSETTILSVAIEVAAERAESAGRQPLPVDVLQIIQERHPRIRENILSVTDEEFDALTSRLRTGLNGLGPHGPFGDVFCNDVAMDVPLDTSVNFDVSQVTETDTLLRAAVQLACWSYGQAISSCAKVLAEERLAPERHHIIVMDELWQILDAWDGSVHRINAITKVNRTQGLGQIMITHSMKDLELSTIERTKIARGFVERSSLLFLGGVAKNEIPDLLSVKPFSAKEQNLLVAWSAEGSINPATGKPNQPPGRGKFLMKTGDSPGIPFSTGAGLTRREREIHDTNEAWSSAFQAHTRSN